MRAFPLIIILNKKVKLAYRTSSKEGKVSKQNTDWKSVKMNEKKNTNFFLMQCYFYTFKEVHRSLFRSR